MRVAVSLYPVVLSGGSGSRLWPMSRRLLPKQFLPLVSEHSMLQDTVLRLRGLDGAGPPIVVSNDEHRFLVAEQMREIGVQPEVQILEPVGRNTAPAVAVVALYARSHHPDACLLVLPSDHLIREVPAFHAAITAALPLAASGSLVTFGIAPQGPVTGYGYIERGEPIRGSERSFRVRRFVEKPDIETAQSYVSSGRFFWNSGMFAFRPERFLEELQRFRPEILAAATSAWEAGTRDLDFLRLNPAAFAACPSDSVDYAVMERTSASAVVQADIGWSDVGSWTALWEAGEKDVNDNVAHGDVDLREATGCYVRAEHRMVVALGVRDLVVVETNDAVLVADKARAQEVKEVVERLDRQARTEHVSHSRVHRPWGYYENIDSGERFQVKRILVKPGGALSLQMHNHRAEHWVVVSGTAKVTRGEEVMLLAENESTYIPIGAKHRLENPGKEPLYLIEVQSGSYLGEDDIVRFEDRYGRGPETRS
ncbi:MAG: mannose-1-phosphate guanylyltransferase/mannose-6-phosphate isomerase [Betaproteobacteria bacterium]|nr:MAG: mannose-1-phosphate guanylyltransferase/mannose-6-phosphate isomerase [Betaproteobacteria bacterium]